MLGPVVQAGLAVVMATQGLEAATFAVLSVLKSFLPQCHMQSQTASFRPCLSR